VEASLSQASVQSFVRESDLFPSSLIIHAPTSSFAACPANFKDVGKVGAYRKAEGYHHRRKPVIDKLELFKAGVLPEELRAHQVQRVSRDYNFIFVVDIDVCQIDGEQKVVVLDR